MARFGASRHIREATLAMMDASSSIIATRHASPNTMAQALYYGMKYIQVVVFDFTVDCSTGDGKFYIIVPQALVNAKLASVAASVITPGVTGTMTIQVANLAEGVDMLTTPMTIDSGELNTGSAAAPPVVDTGFDHRMLALTWVLRIDVDTVHTTPAKGLIVTLGFAITEGLS